MRIDIINYSLSPVFESDSELVGEKGPNEISYIWISDYHYQFGDL